MSSISRPPFIAAISGAAGSVSRTWMSWFQEVQRNATEGHVLLNSQEVSSDSSIDMLNVISSDYEEYRLVLENVSVATDGALLFLRVSEDAGANWESGASGYDWVNTSNDGTAITSTSDAADSEITLMEDGIENTTADGRVCGHIHFYTPSSTAHKKTFMWDLTYENTANVLCRVQGSGRYLSSNAIDAVQILADSGNLAAGCIKLYGIR